ncbi:MAG: efflux RND transporter periplasmic adaptor subunit [Calditrichae bacterium]|nr:efflux RND transporter periplasmic adaptor subunit [Calditrichota bacterium]MCB9057834.1 efflux RND transporter periplasmic adaptor subunit [Calditrichia bacterium]
MRKKSKKWLLWSSIILIVAVAVAAWAMSNGQDEEQNGRATVKVEKKNIVEKALAVGSIEPVNEIDVKSKVSGVVGKLYADVGDFVKAGDPLVEVKPDPTPLELAQAKRDVEMAKIELETLDKEIDRDKKLKEQGFLSDQEFEVLKRQHEEAKLREQMAIERLELIEKGKVTIANTNIETVVKSPITGFILEKNVNLGDPVVPLTSYQPGTAIMRMADMTDLIFKGTVDEIDVGKINEGLGCELQVGAIPGEPILGKVTLISLKAKKEDNTTVFPIEIKISETNDATLRAGYSANANIIIARRDSVLAIPERVVTFRNDSAFVRIPKGEQGSEEKFIKTGLSDAILIEIIEGLKEGDEVLEKEVKEIT